MASISTMPAEAELVLPPGVALELTKLVTPDMKFNRLILRGNLAVKKVQPVGVGSFLVGPYNITLPTIGVVGGAAPANTDNNGFSTLTALIAGEATSTVTIPGNTIYVVNAPVQMPSGKTLKAADGTSVTIKRATGYTGNLLEFVATTASILSNITFDGAYAVSTSLEGVSTAAGVLVNGGADNVVEHCHFQEHPAIALYSFESSNVTIRYNEFDECFHSVYVNGGDFANAGSITGNNFANVTRKSRQSLEITNANSPQVFHNTFAGAGIVNPTRVDPQGTWGCSIYLWNCTFAQIENNTCSQSYWSSCVLNQDVINCTVQNNYFVRGTQGSTGALNACWIDGLNTGGILITLNTLDGSVNLGDLGGNNCAIVNNVINSTQSGIYVQDQAINTVIQRNTINRVSGSNNAGIFLIDKNVPTVSCQVLDNTIVGFTNGIALAITSGSNIIFGVTALGNIFTSNTNKYSVPVGLTLTSGVVLEGYIPVPAPTTPPTPQPTTTPVPTVTPLPTQTPAPTLPPPTTTPLPTPSPPPTTTPSPPPTSPPTLPPTPSPTPTPPPTSTPLPTQPPVTESPHNSTIPPFTQLVDQGLAVWTVSSGVIYRNGVATISSSVTLLLYFSRVIYQQNSPGNWWLWDGVGWSPTVDPRAPAADSPLNAGHSTVLQPAPANSISIVSKGAVADGVTNNIVAIRNALSAATVAKIPCFVPAGDFAYNGTLTASACSIVGVGPTSILRGLDWTNRAIFLTGDGSQVKNLKLLTNGVVNRQPPWEYVGIVLFGCTNFVVQNVYIKHTGATGIQSARAAGPGLIQGNTVSGTLADSYHMTDRAHDITIKLNRTTNSGDDGVACVSYNSDGGKVNHVEASYNWVVNVLGGRSMTVVGGDSINYHNNLLDTNNGNAGFYFSQETSFNTFPVTNVSCTFNTVINCGNTGNGHSGLMIFSQGGGTNDNVVASRNDIQQNGAKSGIQTFGPQTNILLDNNKITNSPTPYINTGPGVTTVLYNGGNVGYQYTTAGGPVQVPVPTIAVTKRRLDLLQIGNLATDCYWVIDGPWGVTVGTNVPESAFTLQHGRSTTVGPTGEVAARWIWSFPQFINGVPLDPSVGGTYNEVKAYPAIIYGNKPGLSTIRAPSQWPGWAYAARLPDNGITTWQQLQAMFPPSQFTQAAWIQDGGSVSTLSPAGPTPGSNLYRQLPLPAGVTASGRWVQTNITGRGHLTYDCWISPTNVQQQGNDAGTPPDTWTEFMVPLAGWGGYARDPSHPWFAAAGSITVTIGGIQFWIFKTQFGDVGSSTPRNRWDCVIYQATSINNNGGTYPKDANGQFTVDFSALIADARSRGFIASPNGYFASIELGNEMVWGTGDTTVYNYKVNG